MSPDRIFNRHGLPAVENPPRHRGIRHQTARHIIKKGIRRARKLKVGNLTIYKAGMFPVELHATKGWRNVTAWS